MKSKVLIIVDMQNDFCRENGVLGNKDAESIIPAIVERCKKAKEDGTEILFTRDTHSKENWEKTVEGQKLPLHCENQSWGWQIVDELKPFITETVDKCTFASLSIAEAVEFIGYYNIEEIELCGTCTDICVLSNALLLRSIFPGIPIKVRANCCAGLTPQKHKEALDVMESCMIEIL